MHVRARPKKRVVATRLLVLIVALSTLPVSSVFAAPSLTHSSVAYAYWVTHLGNGALLHSVRVDEDEDLNGSRQAWAEFDVKYCPYTAADKKTWKHCRIRKQGETRNAQLVINDVAGTARMTAVLRGQRHVVRWKRQNPFPWPAVTEEYCPTPVPGGAGGGFGSLFAAARGTLFGDRLSYGRTVAGTFAHGYHASVCT